MFILFINVQFIYFLEIWCFNKFEELNNLEMIIFY